jgi:hypothetical protein
MPTLVVTPSNQDVTAPAGNTSFTVSTNSSWTASSDQGWCSVTSGGTGNGTIAATYLENVAITPRTASITVFVNGLGPVMVTVTQAGVAPTLLVTPSNRNVPVTAGATNFSVASNSNWTAGSDAAWCIVTPSGNGNGTLDANYESNTGMNPRTAIITVQVNGLTAVNVTVSQEGLVSISEGIQSNILLYPNPSAGKFTLRAVDGWLVQMEVEVVNMEGKVIEVVNCNGKESYTFDLSGQPKGNYFLRIITAEGTAIRKVVIE